MGSCKVLDQVVKPGSGRVPLSATNESIHIKRGRERRCPGPRVGAGSAPLTAVLFYFLSVISLIIHPEPRTELKRSFPLLTFLFISYSIISLFKTFSGAVRRVVKWLLFYMYMKCGDVQTNAAHLYIYCTLYIYIYIYISGLSVSTSRTRDLPDIV